MTETIPRHLGLILDGNRRWARSHTIPTYEGHLAGYDALKEIIFAAFDNGIEYVSIYAFSTENWKRGEDETGKLMKLALRGFKMDLGQFIERGIRVRILGTEEGLDENIILAGRAAQEQTSHFKGRTLCVCFNYGGQREIADAAAQCIRDGLSAEDVTESAIAERLYQPDVPPIDMVVRTSGEQRLSNFMLWRVAYSELLFIDKYWPDMRPDDITEIINEFKTRQRRHGG